MKWLLDGLMVLVLLGVAVTLVWDWASHPDPNGWLEDPWDTEDQLGFDDRSARGRHGPA